MPYPSSLDNFPDPVGGNPLSASGGKTQVQYVTELQDAIQAIETKLGIDSSADVTSIDYKVSNIVGATPPFSPPIIIASKDMPASIKAIADYTCDAVADEVQINLAMERAGALQSRSNGESSANAQQRGRVQLTGGLFMTGDACIIQSGIEFAGMGQLTCLRAKPSAAAFGTTGVGSAPGIIKQKSATTGHMLRVRDMWIDGNYAAGGSNGPHGIYIYQTGTSTGGDPPTSPDSDSTFHDLFISGFYTGTRHGLYLEGNAGNIRGSIIDRVYGRFFSGSGIYINGAPDGHISNSQLGDAARSGNDGTSFAAFRIASANIKLSNLKAFYAGASAGAANTLGWGIWVSSSRSVGAVLETQDCANGIFFDSSPYAASALLLDTCLVDGLLISASKVQLGEVTVQNRAGGRYPTSTYGIRADGLYADCRCTGNVDPTNITNPVYRTGAGVIPGAGNLLGARSAAQISNGTALINQVT